MSYEAALEAAGANVLAFRMFGSYQGDWFALVEKNNARFYVHGSFGSCSYCDAFEAEFGFENDEFCDEHRYDNPRPSCDDCIAKKADYDKRLATFGQSYLDAGEMTQAEAEDYVKPNLEWDSNAEEMLEWVKNPLTSY